MESNCTSLPKLRRKIQTNKEVLCKGCIFLKGNDTCEIAPSVYLLDKRFDCSIYNPITTSVTNFIFIKEEK
jgi:hypothetical protein